MPNFIATLAKLENRHPLRYGVSNRRLFPEYSVDRYLRSLFSTSAAIVQWREADLEEKVNRSLVKMGTELAQRLGRLFFVNSDTRLAIDAGAHGVHLKSHQAIEGALRLRDEAGVRLFVGKSAHSLAEALEIQQQDADYLILGPVFPPLSKISSVAPLGLDILRRAAVEVRIPIFAIGGIEDSNIDPVLATGVAGVAGITWMHRQLKTQP